MGECETSFDKHLFMAEGETEFTQAFICDAHEIEIILPL